MEVFPGVHRLDVGLGNRHLYCYLLRGRDVLLIDSGMPDDPERKIFPYLSSINLQPTDLTGVIASHAHADHYFGNHAIKQAAPGVLVMGHLLDKAWLEDAERYIPEEMQVFDGEYGEPIDPAVVEGFRGLLRPSVKVDRCLKDDEILDLGDGWQVKILHTPSHTFGHLAVYDPAHRCLIASEAVAGRGMACRTGVIENPPLYRDVATQRATIARLRALDIECLLLAHDPVMRGEEVSRFLNESEAFIDRAEEVYREALQSAQRPMTISALTDAVMRALGPYTARFQVNWLTLSHLSDLEKRGAIRREPGAMPVAWVAA